MSDFDVKVYYNHADAQEVLNDYHADISIDLLRQAGNYAYYTSLLVQAESQYDDFLNKVDLLEARLDSVIRKEMVAAGDKITEGGVKAKVASHSKMVALKNAVRLSREQVGYLKGQVEAMRQRKDVLLCIAYNEREERKGSPQVMEAKPKGGRHDKLSEVMMGLKSWASKDSD